MSHDNSNRERRGVPPLRLIEQYLATVVEEEANQSLQTVQEALQSTHGDKWKEDMDSEMRSLKENGVFDLVDRLEGKKVVKSKWVLRVKTNEKGEYKITRLEWWRRGLAKWRG